MWLASSMYLASIKDQARIVDVLSMGSIHQMTSVIAASFIDVATARD